MKCEMSGKRKRSSEDEDDETQKQKCPKTDNDNENPVVDNTDDCTEDDMMEWLMDSVLCPSAVLIEGLPTADDEEVRQYPNNNNPEDSQYNNYNDYLNLTDIDFSVLPPPPPPPNIYERTECEIPQIINGMSDTFLSEELQSTVLAIMLVINVRLIEIMSQNPELEVAADEIIDFLVDSITEDDNLVAVLMPDSDPEEDNTI